ncbi:MAG: hypothetical protein WCW78_03385 [Candidatus Paceibacterota bacterium]
MARLMVYCFVCDVAQSDTTKRKSRKTQFKKFASDGIAREFIRAKSFDDACKKAQTFREELYENLLIPVNDQLIHYTKRKFKLLWNANQRAMTRYAHQYLV